MTRSQAPSGMPVQMSPPTAAVPSEVTPECRTSDAATTNSASTPYPD